MTLQQMSYILEIDRCGSMNKAAQSLFVTQSALSSAIAEVEKELGITVFHRSNRGITLSEDGRELVAQIAPIVEQSRKLSRYYGRRRADHWVHLSVAAQRFPFCAKAFVAFLNSQEPLPMQLSMKEMDMSDVIAEVAAGRSGLGVLCVSDITEPTIRRSLEEKNLAFHFLVALRPHVFMRRGHPLSGEASVSIEQLRAYPHVVFSQPDGNLDYAEEAVPGCSADFDRLVYVSDRATIYNVMAHTDCVSTGSGVLPPGYADERLAAIPLEDRRELRLGYIHRRQHALTDTEQEFLRILKSITGEMV